MADMRNRSGKVGRRYKEIRGLRRCQNEGCGIPLNRDKNGATNIGFNLQRMFQGKPLVKQLNSQETKLLKLEASCF